LDVVPQLPGQSAAAALRETAEVALAADDLGYRRFWLGEQHGVRGVGGAAPAVLAAVLAARTDRIRLGAGGLLLTSHQPLVVAEQFAALAAAYPSRIDLGVADGRSTAAGRSTFAQRLDELCGYLQGESTGDVRLALAGQPPPIFVLADHPRAAVAAAVRGLPVFLAHHRAAAVTASAVAAYREQFEPTVPSVRPYLAVTVGVVAADSDEEALTRFTEYIRVSSRLADAGPQATSAELKVLLEPPLTSRERGLSERLLGDPGHVVGSRATVAGQLGTVVAETTADEVMLVPLAFDGLIRSAILRTVAAGLPRFARTVPRQASPLIATA
jgi:luciferase family oxidoreductase group 1